MKMQEATITIEAMDHQKLESKKPLLQAAWIFGAAFIVLLALMHLLKLTQTNSAKQPFLWVTILVWIGFIAFFSTTIIYSEQAKARAYGPDVLIGLPNRFMVVAYTIWLIVVARLAAVNLLQGPTSSERR